MTLLINKILEAIGAIDREAIESEKYECELKISPEAYRRLNLESDTLFYNKFSDLLVYDGEGNKYLADIPVKITREIQHEGFMISIKNLETQVRPEEF